MLEKLAAWAESCCRAACKACVPECVAECNDVRQAFWSVQAARSCRRRSEPSDLETDAPALAASSRDASGAHCGCCQAVAACLKNAVPSLVICLRMHCPGSLPQSLHWLCACQHNAGGSLGPLRLAFAVSEVVCALSDLGISVELW